MDETETVTNCGGSVLPAEVHDILETKEMPSEEAADNITSQGVDEDPIKDHLSDCSASSSDIETIPQGVPEDQPDDLQSKDCGSSDNVQINGTNHNNVEVHETHENYDNHAETAINLSQGQALDLSEVEEKKAKIQSTLTMLSSQLQAEEPLNNMTSMPIETGLIADLNDRIHILENLKKKLESENADLKRNLKLGADKLNSHDIAAKRTISLLQQDHDNKYKEMTKRCQVLDNDKQAAVMNYARREKELLDLRQKKDAAEQFARNAAKEREKANGQLKMLKLDYNKLKTNLDKKESDLGTSKQETEKLKEEVNSQIIKARWAQNKLKTEVDNHKETKEKCDKMIMEIQQAKEETEQIRKNCQEMIKTYQESEEIKSNALDIELKEKVQLLSEKETQIEELQDVLKQRNEELSLLKIKHKDVFEENKVLKSKVECLEDERLQNGQVLRDYEEVMNKQKLTASEMSEKISDLQQLQSDFEQSQALVTELETKLQEACGKRDVAVDDLERKEQREQELLEFTKKVSSKNTDLAVQVEDLTSRLEYNTRETEKSKQEIAQLQDDLAALTSSEQSAKTTSAKLKTEMGCRLDEKERTICELLLQMEDLKDELRTQKRKNAASVKDLTRQLNQAKRKMDNNDTNSTSSGHNSNRHSVDNGSLGSRTSSTTSLDKICPSTSPDLQCSNQNHIYEPDAVPETTVTGPVSLDRQMLIERIVRLQQIHAKKNEKIDFLNEHVQQLVREMQRKQRLIQHYIMREEVGSLAPPKSANDSQRHKSGLTLELSMEINQKMQSVLEDTLLKNITLKESLETLGKEVQRLCTQPKAS